MSDTAWAYLPNAKHIDAVLADVQKRPEAWDTAADISWIAGTFTKQKLLDDEREAAWKASRAAIFSLARTRAMSAVCDVLDAPETSDVFSVGTDVTDALIAWDSSADLLDCTPDVLRAMIDLAEPPVCHQAALLLPYAIVRSNAKQEVT